MYTKILNVQILVSLLKQHNIRHIVLSAGTRHVPLAHSVENDDFFKCYSVVDERSAGYFALGLAKELGEPVAIACTSSTATCNYVPPIAEAYYQKIPLLILTGDRDPYLLDQLEDQMINQVNMYKNFCKKCVNLPVVEKEKDIWYCQRLINEALLELEHHGKGPVHINFPINQTIEDIADASIKELPLYNKIDRCDKFSDEEKWLSKVEELKKAKRVLVVCGSSAPYSEKTYKYMESFAEKYNCVISTEHLSNIHCKGAYNTYLIGEAITGNVLKQILPDIVILFGGNFISRFKIMLRGNKQGFKTWLINEEGTVMDPFQNLDNIFECTPEYFFKYFSENSGNILNNQLLLNDLNSIKDKIILPDIRKLPETINQIVIEESKHKMLPYPEEKELIPLNYLSSFLAMYELSKVLPKNALLHLGILNSTRIMQMFELDNSIAVYSNVGTDGIDGSMSTFLGQAAARKSPCYLVIGDLSFFYDMNSIAIRNIGAHVRILLVNNGGGAEFYFSMGPERLPNIDMHISAAHQNKAKDWVISNGFKYLTASTADEYIEKLHEFVDYDCPQPIVFEIFTDKINDIRVLKGFRQLIHQDIMMSKVAKKIENLPGLKQLAQTSVGKNMKDKLKKGIKKYI